MSCPDFRQLLVLPHLHVQNANSVSSPLTHGFPSITAFLGLMWALQRKTRAAGFDLAFKAVGVVCHRHQQQVTEDGFVKTFRLTRNPVGSDGKTQAIVEEGRIHLDISLVFAVKSQQWSREPETRDAQIHAVSELLNTMRVAGGTMLPPAQPWLPRYRPFVIEQSGTLEDRCQEFRRKRTRLLPGFALVARDDLLDARFNELRSENPDATRLDAWLSLSRFERRFDANANDGKGAWAPAFARKGWLVPIPVGYGALGQLHEPGTVANARDADTPFRFVESLYSIGQWLSPHRIDAAEHLLWHAETQADNGLYRCRNVYRAAADEPDFDTQYD